MNLLNARMSEEMGIERFRPNIVLSGCLPHGEVSEKLHDPDSIIPHG